MQNRTDELLLLLEKTIEILKEFEKVIIFPDYEALLKISKKNPPDQPEFFTEAMDIYQNIHERAYVFGFDHAAVCFYQSYQRLPMEVKKAIINLLTIYGDDTSACQFANECKEQFLPGSLMFRDIPLINREHLLDIRHLAWKGWESADILAIMTYQFRRFYRKKEQREIILQGLVSGIGKTERLPEPLLAAVCAYLYASLQAGQTQERRKELDKFINSTDYASAVIQLLTQYRSVDRAYKISPRRQALEWMSFRKKQAAFETGWVPVKLRINYGNYAALLCAKGEKLLRKDGYDLNNDTDSSEGVNLADQMYKQGISHQNQIAQAADYFLKAAAVLNSRKHKYKCADSDEFLVENLMEALYSMSSLEIGKWESNLDVQRSYVEQALWLSQYLNPKYLDKRLHSLLDQMCRRYFKEREGHGDDSLPEAMQYLARKEEISNEEFARCLIRLSVYYPGLLSDPVITDCWNNDPCIYQKLSCYAKTIGKNLQQSDEDIVSVMRMHRDRMVKELNDFAFHINRMPQSLEEPYDEWKEFAEWLRLLKSSQFYKLLSVPEENMTKMFLDLLEQTLEACEREDFKAIRNCRREWIALVEDMERDMYSFTVEYIYPYAKKLSDQICEMHDVRYADIKPELIAEPLFAEKDLSRPGIVRVYLRLSCKEGRLAMNDLSGEILESKEIMPGNRQKLCAYLGDGSPEYAFLELPDPKDGILKEYLEFQVDFTYKVPEIGQKETCTRKLSVRLENRIQYKEYIQMYNSGAPLDAEHPKAKDTFYGRDLLINRICQKIYDFPGSTIILHGQKRVGKTSIANHVAYKVKHSGEKFLVVKCGNSNLSISVGEEITDQTIKEFYSNVLHKLAEELEKDTRGCFCLEDEIHQMKKESDRYKSIDRLSVTHQFQDTLSRLRKVFEREKRWKGIRILLWFDEFQQYYINILDGVLKPDFVGFLKAFTEEYGFSLLLVGCEPMLSFIQDVRFGNMFSASMPVHVHYLSKEYAEKLISEPLKKQGYEWNPFAYVTDEIYRLSAGSPFFIQLICEKLINSLNEQQKIYASKQMIIELLYNTGCVTHENFDCLYNPLNLSKGAVSAEDNKKVLIWIAFEYRRNRSVSRQNMVHALKNKTKMEADKVLDELMRRGVVEKTKEGLRIVVKLYEEWIWKNFRQLGYDDILSE